MNQAPIAELLAYLTALEKSLEETSQPQSIEPILDLETAIDVVKIELNNYFRSDHSPESEAAADLSEALNYLIDQLYEVAKSELLPVRA